MQEWIPEWQARTSYGDKPGVVNVGSIRGGFPWRVSRTPERTSLFLDVRVPPTMPMAEARAALGDWVRTLQERFPDFGLDWEIYVSAPGAEIEEGHELVRAIDESHTEVYGSAPDRDTVRWFSDASVLTRYGIATVNYGTSSGLPGAEGENLEIHGLVDTARVYALDRAAGLRGRVSLYQLPHDLPVPVDDGACAHLEGTTVPVLELESTLGPLDLASFGAERAVLYVYPRTGQPGREVPAEWDAIPGARGCTPQSCGFRDHREELRAWACGSPGSRRRRWRSRSSCRSGSGCSTRCSPTPTSAFETSWGCRRSSSRARRLYKRVTLLCSGGQIAKVFYPVFPPDRNAEEVVAWLGS